MPCINLIGVRNRRGPTRTAGAFRGANPAPFGFVGRLGYQQDSDSALKLVGHRYYDPSIGRFLTRDRGKDGRNWYDYARNSPLSVVDDDGFRAISIQGAIHGPGWTYIPYTWWWGGVWRDPSGQLQNFPPPLGVAGGGVGVNGGGLEGVSEGWQEGPGGFALTNSLDIMNDTLGKVAEMEGPLTITGVGGTLMDGGKTLGLGLEWVGYYKLRIADVRRDNENDNDGNGNGAYDPDKSGALAGPYNPYLNHPGGS